MDDQSKNDPKKNPDPLTGESGSHPIGTGVGAADGGLTGAAVGAAVGGPVGAAVGAIVGGVAGAYSGKGVAEVVNPRSKTNTGAKIMRRRSGRTRTHPTNIMRRPTGLVIRA